MNPCRARSSYCMLLGGEIAQNSGDASEGVARAQAAERLLKQWPDRSELLELNTTLFLAESYRAAGRLREANSAFEQAATRLTALGRDARKRPVRSLIIGVLLRLCRERPERRRMLEAMHSAKRERAECRDALLKRPVMRRLERLKVAATIERGIKGVEAATHGDRPGVVVAGLHLSRPRRPGAIRADAVRSGAAPARSLPAAHIVFASLASSSPSTRRRAVTPRLLCDWQIKRSVSRNL